MSFGGVEALGVLVNAATRTAHVQHALDLAAEDADELAAKTPTLSRLVYWSSKALG